MSNIAVAIVGGLVGMLGYGVSDFIAKKSIDKIGNLKTLFYTQLFGVLFLLFYFIKDVSNTFDCLDVFADKLLIQ